MKTIINFLTIALMVFSFAFSAHSETAIAGGISITLNTSTYTELVNTGPACDGFLVWVDDGTGWTYATDSNGKDAVVVDPDIISGLSFCQRVGKGQTVMWVKATSGTPVFYFQADKPQK